MSCAYVNTVIYYGQYCYRVIQFLDIWNFNLLFSYR